MKLPYTSLQHAILHGEEAEPAPLVARRASRRLLHAPLPARAGLRRDRSESRVRLRAAAGRFASRVSVGHRSRSEGARAPRRDRGRRGLRRRRRRVCHDASALPWCASAGHEVVVCGVGPGIVGTGSRFGHGAVAAAEALSVARALGARPILAVRASEADPRSRHTGVSHHTAAVLALVRRGGDRLAGRTRAPDALSGAERDRYGGVARERREVPLSHMGRGPDEDALFFEAALPRPARRLVDALKPDDVQRVFEGQHARRRRRALGRRRARDRRARRGRRRRRR